MKRFVFPGILRTPYCASMIYFSAFRTLHQWPVSVYHSYPNKKPTMPHEIGQCIQYARRGDCPEQSFNFIANSEAGKKYHHSEYPVPAPAFPYFAASLLKDRLMKKN